MTAGVQVFVYPEELRFTSPEALAAEVSALGCSAVSVALVYHRSRRVFPRHAHVSTLSGSTAYFVPDGGRYGALRPEPTQDRELQAAVVRFREACETEGLGFRAWVVGLHHEGLAARHPDAAALAPDGSALGYSLCPSAPEAVEYVAALAAEIAARFEPESIDLEAWQYPAWEPSYTLTLALQPLTETASLLATQCFCAHCRSLIGLTANQLRQRVLRAAASPGDHEARDVLEELVGVRDSGAARIAAAVAAAVQAEGAELRLFGSGAPAQARLQGLSPAALDQADSILLGCARLAGDDLIARFTELRSLAGERPATASTNWTPQRSPESMADDVDRLVAAGANGLALYNLSLVPEAGVEAFRAAATAFHRAAA